MIDIIPTNSTFRTWLDRTNLIIQKINDNSLEGSILSQPVTLVKGDADGKIDESWLIGYLKSGGSDLTGTINYTGPNGQIVSINGQTVLELAGDGVVVGAENGLQITSGNQPVELDGNVDYTEDQIVIASASGIQIHTNLDAGWQLRSTFEFTFDGIFRSDSAELVNLEVSGSTEFTNVTMTGNLVVGGTINETSDKRLKENIEELDDEESLDLVNLLRPVRFNKKGMDLVELGFLAQEVETILPEVVSSDDDGIMQVQYQRVVPVLVQAIRKLTERVNELENR